MSDAMSSPIEIRIRADLADKLRRVLATRNLPVQPDFFLSCYEGYVDLTRLKGERELSVELAWIRSELRTFGAPTLPEVKPLHRRAMLHRLVARHTSETWPRAACV